jgi:hypothetical protein
VNTRRSAKALSLTIHPQRCDEGGLGDVDLAELALPLVAFFAFSE